MKVLHHIIHKMMFLVAMSVSVLVFITSAGNPFVHALRMAVFACQRGISLCVTCINEPDCSALPHVTILQTTKKKNIYIYMYIP